MWQGRLEVSGSIGSSQRPLSPQAGAPPGPEKDKLGQTCSLQLGEKKMDPVPCCQHWEKGRMLFSHSLRALPPGTWIRPSRNGRRHRACGALAPGGALRGGGDGGGGELGASGALGGDGVGGWWQRWWG